MKWLALLVVLSACAERVQYRPCRTYEEGETRAACLVDICPCMYPWTGLDRCCIGQTQECAR